MRQPNLLLPAALFVVAAGLRGEPLTLRDALRMAIESNAYLAAGEQRLGVGKGLLQQAALKPNPRLYLQQENIRFWQRAGADYGRDTDTFAYLSLTIERPGKRDSRIAYAAANDARNQAEQDLLRRQLIARTAAAYWSAAGAAQAALLLKEEKENLSQVVRYTESRVKEGAAAGADLLRIQLEAQRVDALLSTAELDIERTRLALYREIGVAAPSFVQFADAFDHLRVLAPPGLSEVLDKRPEVAVARHGLAQAEANLTLQQINSKTDPEFFGGYKRTAGYDTLLAGVQINLPVRNRNQGLIAAAEAEVRAARDILRAVEAQIASELDGWTRDYTLKRKLVSTGLPSMLQRAKDSARIAQLAFRDGGVDLLRLLDAERTRIETQLLYTRSLTDFQQSVVALQIAAGMNP